MSSYLSFHHSIEKTKSMNYTTFQKHCISCKNTKCGYSNLETCADIQRKLNHYRICNVKRCRSCFLIRHKQLPLNDSYISDLNKISDTWLNLIVRKSEVLWYIFLDDGYMRWIIYMRRILNALLHTQIVRFNHPMRKLDWVMRLLCSFLCIKSLKTF